MTLVERMQETFSAQIFYGDPIENDGTVLLPAPGWPEAEEEVLQVKSLVIMETAEVLVS